MKYMFFIIALISLFNGQHYSQENNTINMKILDEKSGREILFGECSRDAFKDTAFSSWWNEEYLNYTPNKADMDDLKALITDQSILIVFGTWCGDSRRELPRFFRIIDEIGVKESSIKLVAVDRNKVADKGQTEGLSIKYVPTFIVYSAGVELGRIIETPEATLEQDLINILYGMKK